MGGSPDGDAFCDGVCNVQKPAQADRKQITNNARQNDDSRRQGNHSAKFRCNILTDGRGDGFGQQTHGADRIQLK